MIQYSERLMSMPVVGVPIAKQSDRTFKNALSRGFATARVSCLGVPVLV